MWPAGCETTPADVSAAGTAASVTDWPLLAAARPATAALTTSVCSALGASVAFTVERGGDGRRSRLQSADLGRNHMRDRIRGDAGRGHHRRQSRNDLADRSRHDGIAGFD